jgi:SAM-dependent methyltransferase
MHYIFLRSKLRSAYYKTKILFTKLLNNTESISSIKKISGGDNLEKLLNDPGPVKFRDLTAFHKYYESVADRRLSIERQLGDKYKNKTGWLFKGYCRCCEKDTAFLADWQYSDGSAPNYRERLFCNHCGLNNRQRFIMYYAKNLLRDRKGVLRLFCYEQATSFYRHLAGRLDNADVTGSEYLGGDKTSGEIINGIRCEDALGLSFENEAFDIIISNDVYEHVPDVMKALSEAYRCLKKNGMLIFSVPFFMNKKTTEQRAFIDNKGKTVHVLPEQSHANPVSRKGSLVYYDFGWDILSYCKEAGFKDAYAVAYYSMIYGYIGNGMQFIFCAEKQ